MRRVLLARGKKLPGILASIDARLTDSGPRKKSQSALYINTHTHEKTAAVGQQVSGSLFPCRDQLSPDRLWGKRSLNALPREMNSERQSLTRSDLLLSACYARFIRSRNSICTNTEYLFEPQTKAVV